TPSELIADCFEFARDIREIDMRASPYDLRALGFAPIAIETPAGRAEYERHQRTFAARAEPLRACLIALCERLLSPEVDGDLWAPSERVRLPTAAFESPAGRAETCSPPASRVPPRSNFNNRGQST
ncbi:MAG: hypothetical protein ABIZ49_08540, partial [Opitutaceae bacterium]